MTHVIAFDFDGVIANTDPAKAAYARRAFGLELGENLMKRRYFVDLYGASDGERMYAQIIREVYGSERLLNEVAPVEGAAETIARLQALGWRCVIVTARTGVLEDDTDSLAAWAWRYLALHRISIAREDFINVSEGSKAPACLSVGACGLVDDDYLKLLPVMEAGLVGYLFTTQTNRGDEQRYAPFRAIRVSGWADLLQRL